MFFMLPGITVACNQTGLQLSENQAGLGLKSDTILDQLVFVSHVDPETLKVLLHHFLEFPDFLKEFMIYA